MLFLLCTQATWKESKSKLEKDPQGRAANPHLDQSDLEKLFREHIKILHEVSCSLLGFNYNDSPLLMCYLLPLMPRLNNVQVCLQEINYFNLVNFLLRSYCFILHVHALVTL